jgi:hypothetical protein
LQEEIQEYIQTANRFGSAACKNCGHVTWYTSDEVNDLFDLLTKKEENRLLVFERGFPQYGRWSRYNL